MNEEQRQHYLQAMGIPLWLCRIEKADVKQTRFENTVLTEVPTTGNVAAFHKSDTESDSSQTAHSTITAANTNQAYPDVQPNIIATVNVSLDWDTLAIQVAQCQACPELVANRSCTVFGVGNRKAQLMVIGEAPGAEEDRQGEPFVGKAGQLLNSMLGAIGLKREQVYIANILKCRPPNNRDPHVEEALRCEHWLLQQIELIAPTLILAVGRISAQNLLKNTITVGQLRGHVHQYGPQHIPLIVTYHPAYLLRSPRQKANAWKDLQIVAGLLRNL